jgi:predicted acylesterase/phospholipase RssA
MSTSRSDTGSSSTTYFSNCWGVFEGGGVRAAAHAGAYHAARAAGVTFGRVAGTSGGSIVAALIAAGASPSELLRALLDTPMSEFIAEAERSESIFEDSQLIKRLVRPITWGKVRKFIDVSIYSGLHNSRPIESWMEERLQALIGARRQLGVSGPVQFQELRLPLHVVATDLATGRPKVWSRETTPEDSVAHAVRCSCSIPFFYQAIGSPQSVLVDGGAISNLPSFVFSKLQADRERRNLSSRALAFRLIAEPIQLRQVKNLQDFAIRLSGAVVDAGTHIQSTLQPQVYDVAIPTGTIQSTDFHSVGKNEKLALYRAGRKAVRNFIAQERGVVRDGNSLHVYRGTDEKMLLLVQSLHQCQSTFVAVTDSTRWIDYIYPALLDAARRGIQIICITKSASDSEDIRRLSVLASLGATNVLQAANEDLPYDGFLFDVNEESAVSVLSTYDRARTDEWYTRESIRLYSWSSDRAICQMLAGRIKDLWVPTGRCPKKIPYVPCTEDELFTRLRLVPQYGNSRFQQKRMSLTDDIVVLQEAVKEYKFLQMRGHINSLKSAGCELFELTKVDLGNGRSSIVTPPVLERLGGKYVVIEGSARLFYCLSMNISNVNVIVVDNVQARLPSSIQRPLSTLRLTSSTKSLSENYQHLDKTLFRWIESAVHPSV